MKRFWFVVRILLLGFAGTALAAPFQNGSFEIGAPAVCNPAAPSLPQGSIAIPGWTVILGDIDWACSPGNWDAQEGTYSLDLLGTGNIGGVQQTFDTVPGVSYQVSFQLAGNPGSVPNNSSVKPLSVTVAGVTQNYTFNVAGHTGTTMGWTPQTFTFVANAATSTISFVSDMTGGAGGGFAGAALDNVRINALTAGLIQNGSFEIGAPAVCNPNAAALGAGSTAIPGWTVSVGNIDWACTGNWNAQEGTQSLDLIGGGTSIGGIAQSFTTVPGAAYQVSFYLAGNPSLSFPPTVKPLAVSVDGVNYANYTFDISGHSAASMGWVQNTFTFVANGSTSTLDFRSDVGASSFAGAALDNVSVVRTFLGSATQLVGTPNPSSFGSSVTFTVQVLGGGSGSPTGTISFTDNGSPITGCTAVPLGPTGSPQIGTAECIAPLLAIGSHTIAATYSGDVVNAASGNTLTQVVNAVAIGATPWTGSAGSVTNPGPITYNTDIRPPPYPGTPIGSSPTVVSDGTSGTNAVFTYATVNSSCCHTGDWTFETTAATSGPVTRNWLYSGYHGTCNARAELTAFVRRSGLIISSQTVYSAFDLNCVDSLPAGGFGEYGSVDFGVLAAGDTYGFIMHASNYDSNGGVSGMLTVTTGALSTTTALATSATPSPSGVNVSFTATVTGSAPGGSVTFTQEGRMIQGCVAIPLVGGAAVCPTNGLAPGLRHIVALYTGDTVNAGSVSAPLAQVIGTPSAATTTSLTSLPNPASIGASVTFTATVTTTVPGSNPTGTVNFVNGVPSIPGCSAVPLIGTGDSRTASCTTSTLGAGSWLISALYSGDPDNTSSNGATTEVINAAPAIAAPTLIRAIEDAGGSSTFVIGRVDNALPPGTNVQAFTAASCVAGVPGVLSAIGSPLVPVTTPDGYIGAAVTGVSSGQFLVIKLTDASGTPISDVSACLPSLGGNDFWTTALLVGGDNTSAGSSSTNDYIDAPGKTRWYKFKVAPGQRIAVTLSALPADYDLAVFKDIGAAFAAQLAPADTAALTKLSAEFAPSAFSPSAFSPSAFSPSAFSPSAFSPSAFSPSAFSPSAFSPSAFSPSAFSPSAFSPSAFSPSAFSPSAFSPSAFSPSAFSPSAFSPSAFSPSAFSGNADVIQTAFSSAQTRSIIAVSATPGTGDESAVVDSWNNSGYYYARVTGRGGAFSTAAQFNVGVAKSASSCSSVNPLPAISRVSTASTSRTVIVTDSSVLADGTLAAKLATFATRSEIAGVIVDVGGDGRVQTLKAQAAANTSCPYATNLVAEEIKSIVDSYRNTNLKYVVIVGGDDVVPFFRYPDEALLGPESGYVPPVTGASDASLRGNYVLSQETYGAKTRISLGTSDFPIPGLAVGRLVKTPAEIVGMLDAYVSANGNVQPSSSLVTGYDFLADAATAVTAELRSGTGVAPDTLITPNGVSPQATGVPPLSWRASDLSGALFSKRHDVVFLGGHFSANSALAADFATNLITSDLAASTTDFTNSIVFSAGCHSGYNIVNRDAITGATFTLDWAQAFAQKKATLIAGTGYQYGDTDFIEYSERLYLNFAKELHAGTGPVAVGDAHVKAKLDYLAATPDIRGIHKKALLESTLYGLPMLGVNMPSGRGGGSSVLTGVIAPTLAAALTPAATLDLRIADLHLNPSDLATTAHTQVLTGATLQIAGPTASWLSGNVDGVVSNPAEPALPLKVVNVTPTDGAIVLRGVGFRGGAYADSIVVPLTGAPATEIRGVHVSFASPYFFPMRPWTINYFGALAGNGATSLLVTPAQHRATDLDAATGAVRSTLRSYSNLDLRLYYSGNHGNGTQQVSLSDAPSIVSVGAQSPATGTATFSAQVTGDPAATIQQVWVVYTNGGTWVPVDLAQCIAPLPAACGTTTDSQIWKGTASVPTGSLQYVVQAANGLGLVAFDDNRGAYYTFTGTAALPQEPAATALAFESAPTGAAYGDAVNVTARLTSNSQPVPGAVVNVNVGGIPNSGLTDANGRLTLSATIANAPGNYTITASYLGSSTLQASAASPSPFAVSAAPAKLTALPSPAIGVTLTEPVVTGNVTTQVPVAGQSVSFLVTGPGFSQTIVVNTDTAGNATLPTSGLPAGTYSITASFLPASVAGGVSNYSGATLALQTLPVTARGTTTTVTASSNPAPVGQLVTLSAAVVPVSPSTRTPTGTVTFKDGNATLESHPLSGGVASPLVTNALAVGGHSITAVYSGDAWFAGSTSTTLTVTISPTSTTTVLTADKTSPVLFGTTINLTAAVTPATATGTVAFRDGSATLGSVTLSGGTGSFATSTLGIGTHTLTARYSGDTNDATSTSAPLTLIITPAFTASGTMLQPRVSHTATLLNDGRVLVAGGSGAGDDDTRASRTAEIYCPNPYTPPATPVRTLAQWCPNGVGKFSAAGRGNAAQVGAGNLVQARTYHTATLLPDGTVLLVGGYDSSGITTASAEIYDATDPAADKFTAVASLPGNAAAGHTATLIAKSGKTYVLVVGGGSAKSWLYDVQAKTWSVSGTMTGVRSSHTASLVGTKVLVAGGTDALGRTLQTTTIYDIATGSFSGGPTMLSPRELHTASVIANGKVLLAGGRASTGIITNTVALAPLAEIYDPSNPTTPFAAAAFASGTGRFGHSASALIAANGQPDGRVFAAGGGLNVLCGQQLATTEFYASGAFARGGTMNAARVRHSATVLKDGRVLVAGGRGTTGNNCGPLNTVEIWSAPPAP